MAQTKDVEDRTKCKRTTNKRREIKIKRVYKKPKKTYKGNGTDKFRPITGHEDPEGE
jgi:hypothetical protein